MFVEIALPVPHSQTYTYRVLPEMEDAIVPGALAVVPFRDQAMIGVIWEIIETPEVPGRNIRDISALGDPELTVSAELLCVARLAARRYVTTPGMVLKAALPPGAMQRRKLFFYPGREKQSGPVADSIRDFLGLVEGHPGRYSFADIRRLGGVSRLEIEALERSGAVTVSPFMATRQGSPRGKERWIKAVAGANSETLKAGSKAMALFAALEENPAGFRLGALRELGFSSASAMTLAKKGLAEFLYRDREQGEIGAMKSLGREDAPVLTLWQQAALERISAGMASKKNQGFLLFGVTSSGKTQVYLEAAKTALALGRSVLVLVPEISLTPQIIVRFERFLGTPPLVWHSHLSAIDRLSVYKACNSGRGRLVIGTRSAIFAPLKNLGLIVVDEEQDHSYKQDDPSPRYNARDLALERGRMAQAVVVLGSATPSVETYYRASQGELETLILPQRVAGSGAPKIELISTAFKPEEGRKQAVIFPRGFRPISEKLYEELSIRLKKKEQVIILLNRRGYSSAVVCFECGWVGKCPDCEIGWTYHKTRDRMICHYCGREQKGPTACAKCGSLRLSFRSPGTERLEETIMSILPGAKTVRLDTDVASRKWEARDVLDDFGRGKYQILLGTQMVAKGHHFPRVGLVGVISADIGLSLPDFRAGERVLQLLTQAAGRAGRWSKRGDSGMVMIQTFSPENPIFGYLKTNDYQGFLEDELKTRCALGYPPYKRLALIVVSSGAWLAAKEGAEAIKAELSGRAADKGMDILGPVESPIYKLGKMFRYQILLKMPPDLEPAELLGGISDFMKVSKGLAIRIDVDPVSFM